MESVIDVKNNTFFDDEEDNRSHSSITKQQENYYLENPGECPFCKSGKIEMSNTKLDNYKDRAYQKMVCKNCGMEWEDVYKLIGIINITDKECQGEIK